jgi:hypothetical protein
MTEHLPAIPEGDTERRAFWSRCTLMIGSIQPFSPALRRTTGTATSKIDLLETEITSEDQVYSLCSS